MQTLRSVYVSTAEWRWVIVISGLLVALTLVPYAWALATNETADGWQFMGMLSNPKDGATYLSKIEQGRRGAWLFELRHTPESHNGAGFHTFYIFLGHIARLTGLSSRLIFHIARVATSLLMYISIYQLGATIWIRLRPRRLFFTLLSVGSGLGWLLLLLDPGELAADMNIPEAFPFYAAYTNPHFPLSIASLALIAALYIIVFRRGFTAPPSVDNGGLGLMLLAMALSLVQPTALVSIGAALGLYVLARWYLTKEFPNHELRWSAMLWLPAIPFAVYDFAVFHFNDIMGEFNRQNQRRLALGLVIPIVYFAVRALEDYWFYIVPKNWRAPAIIALIVFVVPSNVIVLAIPLVGAVASPERGLDAGLLIDDDYWEQLQWLDANGENDAVVLAAPTISLWIPAYTRQRVVYGHEYETVPKAERLRQVEDWYRGTDCDTLLGDGLPFEVRYILWGPQERDLGYEDADDNDDDDASLLLYPDTGKCFEQIPASRIAEEVIHGDVTLYVLAGSN